MSFFSSLIVSFKFLMDLSLLSFFRITDKFAFFDGDTYLPSREYEVTINCGREAFCVVFFLAAFFVVEAFFFFVTFIDICDVDVY